MVICTHLSIFSSHTGFFSPSQISLTPESSRRLLFRFISFRMVLEERTVARTEQLFSVSSQLFSLNTKTALFIIQHIFNTHQINRSSYLITHVTDSTFILNKTKVINHVHSLHCFHFATRVHQKSSEFLSIQIS